MLEDKLNRILKEIAQVAFKDINLKTLFEKNGGPIAMASEGWEFTMMNVKAHVLYFA